MNGTDQQSQPFFCCFGSRRFSSLATNGQHGLKAVIKEAMFICIENFPWLHRCVYGPMPGGSSQSTGWVGDGKSKKKKKKKKERRGGGKQHLHTYEKDCI